MKRSKFNNPWLEMWVRQSCSYHLAADTVTRNLDTYWTHAPRTLVDYCLPPCDESLNPLEFHGKRQKPLA